MKIEAYGKYTNATSTGSNLSGFASALLAAYSLPVPAGGETGTPSAALNTWGGLVAGGSGGSGTVKAFVNIIVFDKNYRLLDMMWDPIDANANQVGATPIIAHDYMMREYTAKEESIVYMYVSNESPTLVDVYFDYVTMTYTPSNIVQYNEYYPFGLSTANSWTRENTTGNNFLYNGGTELNTTTQVYDLHYRNYDPVLGRMNQVDPVASKYGSVTPYNYAFNAPTNMNDPLGDDPGSSASCSWCNPKPRPTDTGSGGGGGGGGGGNPYASLMGRSAGFFEPGWQPGSGSLSTYGGMTGAQFSQWADKFQSKSDRLFFQSSYAAAANTPYAQASFVMGQNGVNQGYNALLSITGRLLYLTKDNRVVQRSNGGWVSTGSTTLYDFLANTSFSFGASSPTAPSGWDKFLSGFLGSKSEMQFASGTANGVGFTAMVGEAALGVEARNGATALIRADAAAARGLLKSAVGPGIGVFGAVASIVETATDGSEFTTGDIAKSAISLGLAAAAFTFAAPAVAVYGLVDLGFAVFSGSSLTDRIGAGIDSALKN